MFLYTVFVEPSWIAVTRLDVPVRGLPPALEGATLVHLTDPHVGVGAGATVLHRAVNLANHESPDLVLLTGDFLDSHADPESAGVILVDELRRLQAAKGVFAVLGNHDMSVGKARMTRLLESAGVTVLATERCSVTLDGVPVWLLGVEDAGVEFCRDFSVFKSAAHPQATALAGWLAEIPSSDVRLLLVHNPDFAMMLPPGRLDLVLAGHTHGGYLRLPFVGAPLTPSCFGQTLIAGPVEVDDTLVYVNRGLGGVHIRFNARPEVTVLHLVVEK
ncbi:MAG: metallophosphoesterase [Anaerolineae bacterium]|nr:metallophosphoesterase [Anaerolineae bacterium]